MASATFCDEVGRLADRYQRHAMHVQGTPLGEVNSDIEHIVHRGRSGEKFDAIVNLLLVNPDEQSILFARTRAEVTAMTRELGRAGFSVVSLSGEMTQPARDRALATFRRGSFKVLVATDVASRGLDIQSVKQIIHVEPPNDADGYVHRSGRTGRAGHRGTSHVLVNPSGIGYIKLLMRRAGVKFSVLPIPSAESLILARNQRLYSELSTPANADSAPSTHLSALAERLCSECDVPELVTRLLARVCTIEIEPRHVCSPRVEPAQPKANRNFGAFHVTWGENQGADARRLLAIVCRRGRIRSNDVGEIRIGPTSSVIEIRTQVAAAFAKAAQIPDRRDPRVHIAPLREARKLRAQL